MSVDSALSTLSHRRGLQVFLWLILLAGIATYITVTDARREKLRGDFSSYTLAASKVMFAGGDPYDKGEVDHNYKYFPTNAILVWPFTQLSVYAAQGIWLALNVGLLIWMFYSLRAMLRPLRIPWWVYVGTFAVVFRLVFMNLRLGQWNTSVFCLSIIGLRYLGERKLWGSLFLGLATVLKFMPAIFLLYLAVRGRWKDFSATVLAIAFWVFLLPVIVLGPARTVELLQNYRAESSARVKAITVGKDVSSVSMHSTIYRTFCPIPVKIKDDYYVANIANLSREQSSLIAKVFSLCVLVAAAGWLFRQHRNRELINPLGELITIGLFYLVWFMASPGVRHAQLISVTPLFFAMFAAVANTRGKPRGIIIGVLALTTILYTLPAEIVKDSSYNVFFEANGILAWAVVFHAVAGVITYYQAGLRSEVKPALLPGSGVHSG